MDYRTAQSVIAELCVEALRDASGGLVSVPSMDAAVVHRRPRGGVAAFSIPQPTAGFARLVASRLTGAARAGVRVVDAAVTNAFRPQARVVVGFEFD